MKLKVGDKVEVIDGNWSGKSGVIMAIVKDSYVDGDYKRSRNEYIVQFKRPTEWSWFTRKEIRKLKGIKRGKNEG